MKLLHRTTRKLRMSEAGEKLYLQAEKILNLAGAVQQDINDLTQEASGVLRFTAPISIGDRIIEDLLPKFIALCPKVTVELNFSNRAYDLASGENDIALRAFDVLPELVVAKSLGRVRNVLVASKAYLKNSEKINGIHDLNRHNCIQFSHQRDWNIWDFYQQSSTSTSTSTSAVQRIVATGNLATSKYASAKVLALKGLGIANLPFYAVDKFIEQGQLVRVLPNYQLCLHEMTIIHAAQRQLPKKLQIFKGLIVDWFTEHPEYLWQ